MDRKRLLEYLPPFMRQFIEIQEIMQSANYETDMVDTNIQNCLNNAFIKDCDEYAIQKYEALLGIESNTNESLDTRKELVMSQWNNSNVYSYKIFLKRLAALCGDGNYKIESDTDFENYFIHLCVNTDDISFEELKNFLETWLPAHLNRYYEFIFNTNFFIGIAQISVFQYYLFHETEGINTEDLPDYLADEDENLVLDSYGNIFIAD